MKKIIAIIMALTMCASITACSGETTSVTKNPLFTCENLNEAHNQFYDLMKNAKTEEEKQELSDFMVEYYLNDLNGFLYYEAAPSSILTNDSRAIYIKDKDEVYIVPYSEEDLNDMNLALEDIPQIENSELYKYHIAETYANARDITVSNGTFPISSVYVIFESDYHADKEENESCKSIEFNSSLDGSVNGSYSVSGYFADEMEMASNRMADGIDSLGRKYFKDKSSASFDASKQEHIIHYGYEDFEPETSESETPAIGMTKSEILDSTWGKPDKKNIDEYAWGTEEQWVYDGKGYIYFENDVVTSIQHRE